VISPKLFVRQLRPAPFSEYAEFKFPGIVLSNGALQANFLYITHLYFVLGYFDT